MQRRPTVLAPMAVAAVLLSGCGDDGAPSASAPPEPAVRGDLVDPSGAEKGSVQVSFDGGKAVLVVEASGLEPGLHGLHVHTTGRCEPDSPDPADPAKTGAFLSAGGHLAASGQQHGEHAGDLPSLLVADDGTALLTVGTDRLDEQLLLDADGSALVVHALPDNSGNVPDRYAPQGPDETTTKTGDSGGRVACAPLTAAE